MHMKRIGWIIAVFCCLTCVSVKASAAELGDVKAKSAVLMTEDGTVLFEQQADEPLPPASVTKIMTMLLVMEAVDSGKAGWDDSVTASAHAAEMGGSQIFLKENEQMTLRDMMKSIAVASANDAAVAVAEHLGGSEQAFVHSMNERAKELGCTGTTFVNPNGLDTDGEETRTTARDLGRISAELLRHEEILDYTGIWMDTVRDGTFGLANTNKMLRQYKGMQGLKTGYTSTAGYCISAVAQRDGTRLIAVVLGEPDKQARNADIAAMLNYGFANYTMTEILDGTPLPPVAVDLGSKPAAAVKLKDDRPIFMEKTQAEQVRRTVKLQASAAAPVKKGDRLGEVILTYGDNQTERRAVIAAESVPKKTLSVIYRDLLLLFLMKKPAF